MKIKLLGTRGSCAISNRNTRIYGGDSSCVKVQSGDNVLYIDAGTGLMSESNKTISNAVVLLTHYHLDHISALALFASKCKKLTIFAPSFNNKSCVEVLNSLIAPPLWPVGLSAMSDVTFNTVLPNSTFDVNGFSVSCVSLCHPDGAIGYCIERGDKRMCYLCDHEHDLCNNKKEIEKFVNMADLLIADAPYDEISYPPCIGYGHSSCEAIINLAKEAKIKQTRLTHHNPNASDADLVQAEAKLSRNDTKTAYAKQGEIIIL